MKPACGPCLARGGEPCDFTLPDRENRIASLESKIRLLEREIQRADGSALDPIEVKSRLWDQVNATFPEDGTPRRPLPAIFPLFFATSSTTGPLPMARVQSSFMPTGYGSLISRADIESAASSWDPQSNPSLALTVLL